MHCPLFSRCEPGVCYDIGLVVGALNQITENEEYQILTEITFQKIKTFQQVIRGNARWAF